MLLPLLGCCYDRRTKHDPNLLLLLQVLLWSKPSPMLSMRLCWRLC
jgi:hypothetical protein